MRTLMVAGALLLTPAAAFGEPAQVVFQGFGLLDRQWAPECSNAASVDNPHVDFRAGSEGEVVSTYDAGSKFVREILIISTAERLADGSLRFQQRVAAKNTAQQVTLAWKDGKYRVWSVLRSDGKVMIQDGLFPASGRATHWFQRCSS